MPVKKDGAIGILHHEIAELTVTKNELQAESHRPRREGRGPEGSRRFGRVLATTGSTIDKPGMVSAEDVAKAEGELKVADAQIKEAEENRGIAEAELDLAKQHARRAHDRRPVRRDRHQADEEPRRERPGQRGGRRARQPAAGCAPTPTCRSSTPSASRKGRSSRSSRGITARARRAAADREEDDSAARSRSSTPRSSRSPRRPCGSAPSSRTRATCGRA